ncbi:ribonuclease III [Leptolyngbyaceae cyanobacterium JSC-12]|nr:ribonuclease III [Leptolyngbyaceae cyanobacterium JSC-12]
MHQAALPRFQNSALLQQALTHRSYVNEHPSETLHNERLEFLGDAVLNFLSGEFLYKRFPEKPEGELTPLRASLVDASQLAKFAIALELGTQLRLGRGAEQDGGRTNPNLLSSAFEAIVGAYFLDTGSDIHLVRMYVVPFFESVVDTLEVIAPAINYKSRFQEWAQANHRENPTYAIAHESGPDHAKTYVTEVFVNGKFYGRGTGRKKQDAEKDAARDALDRLNLL